MHLKSPKKRTQHRTYKCSYHRSHEANRYRPHEASHHRSHETSQHHSHEASRYRSHKSNYKITYHRTSIYTYTRLYSPSTKWTRLDTQSHLGANPEIEKRR
ncbi:hypothetical protein K440DRAFT_617893 [Wilcoxina mikolae CBS 423.85]|nr:hypothetical protein K440DRAFT_617893 [Wilcoxina mikolae CBS 423.85]